jgi:elongation factor 2
MVRKEAVVEEIAKTMKDLDRIRNIAIIAHVDHGKSTLSDSLVALAGLISKDMAGEQRVLDFEAIEQARGITIKAADISLGFNYKNLDYIINLIDTPGHVDFGGHVTRALRAVDGVVLVVDAVEGIMPQTETVLRQSLNEKGKPVVFINKIDRLINELKLNFDQTFERLLNIINGINKLIENYAPEEFKDSWKINVEKGTVAFGSAFNKWAISVPHMKESGITFKDIFKMSSEGDNKKLQEIAPVDKVILSMVIENLPSPKIAQVYRIPRIWHGDLETEDGKAMLAADASKKVNIIIFGITYDPHAGEVAIGRVFSGTVKKGTELYLSGSLKREKVQQVGIFMGADRVLIDEVSAGNIAALVGFKDVSIGETASENEIAPFEAIKHYSQPVVAKAIEAKETKDTMRLIDALRALSKEDQTLYVEINQETGEHIIRGMGELHLEIIETKLKDDFKIQITTSEPIVVYKETIEKEVKDIEGKSPNKHTRFYINISPLEPGVVDLLENGVIKEGRPKGKLHVDELVKAGMAREEAKGLVDVSNKSMLIDATHGVQYLNEVMELLIDGFEEATKDGPLAREKCTGIKVLITDATIHEDPVHRGPAQIIPAIRKPIYAGMLLSGVVLLEPKQKFTINIPQEYISDVITLLQSKRGQVMDIQQEREQATIVAKLPVSEVIKGFSNDMRGATKGKAIWYPEYAGYEKLPKDIQDKVVKEIRIRKGQPPEPPAPSQFMD